jgi:hypothetical protein
MRRCASIAEKSAFFGAPRGAVSAPSGVTFNSGSSMSVVALVGYTTPGSASFINVDNASLSSSP